MLGYEDLQRGLDLITDNSARTLNLGEGYGIEAGRPANLLILSAPSDYEMIRSQGHALASIRTGKLLMQRTPARVERCCLALLALHPTECNTPACRSLSDMRPNRRLQAKRQP